MNQVLSKNTMLQQIKAFGVFMSNFSIFGKYHPPYFEDNFDQRSAGFAAKFLGVCTTTTILLWFSVIFIATAAEAKAEEEQAVLKTFSRLFRL